MSMKRREFTAACMTTAASLFLGHQATANTDKEAEDVPTHKNPFVLKGVYFHDGFTVDPKHHAPLHWGREEWLRQIRWMHACGINAVEFATMFEFSRLPQTDMERQKIADRLVVLELAQSLGLEFGYILSNTVMSTVPDGETPGDQLLNRAVQLCPQIPENFERTVALQNWYMQTYQKAQFFEEFAADWGGCHCGVCNVTDYMRYVDALARKLHDINPQARMYANTWCIAYWGPSPEEQGWLNVFRNEIRGSREVIEQLSTMPENTHLTLPCHHLYRPLAFEVYGGKARTPVFPTAEDVAKVKAMGRDVMAWPHFVMDDDTGRMPQWGIIHSEVRYIRDLLLSLQDKGINRVIGNLYLPYLQLLNTYAYGRLLENPTLEPEMVITDFARLIAHHDDAQQLCDVLIWLENNSYWEQQMPEDGRLPALDCTLTRDTVQKAASTIRPNDSPGLPLPYPPAEWLQDLQRSILRMDWSV